MAANIALLAMAALSVVAGVKVLEYLDRRHSPYAWKIRLPAILAWLVGSLIATVGVLAIVVALSGGE